jgi:hypothetical protein
MRHNARHSTAQTAVVALLAACDSAGSRSQARLRSFSAPHFKDLEAEYIDGDRPLAEIRHDPLGTGIQRGHDNDDLVLMREDLGIEAYAKSCFKILCKVPALLEPGLDPGHGLGVERLDPGGIIDRLGNHLSRGSAALELDQDQRAVRRDRQQIDAPVKAGILLLADNHPLVGDNLRFCHNHFFQLPFRGKPGFGKTLG